MPSPSPSPSPPSKRSPPFQSSPGRRARRFPSMRPSCWISSGEPNACWESSISSARCSAVIELSIRCAAAERVGEGVEQLVDVAGVPRRIREEVSMFAHEVVEVLLGVLPQPVLLEQLVEVAQHLVDRGPVLVGGALERLLHAGEALVEHLASEQVLDLLVGLARLAALPVVRRQLADRGRRGGRQVLQLHLAQRPVAVVHRDVAGELLALLEHRLVEQLPDLLEGAVEVVPLGAARAASPRPGARGRRGRSGRVRPRRRNSCIARSGL